PWPAAVEPAWPELVGDPVGRGGGLRTSKKPAPLPESSATAMAKGGKGGKGGKSSKSKPKAAKAAKGIKVAAKAGQGRAARKRRRSD
ncbi:MAG: hypothetical protein ACO3PJ_04870, partial [Burkholderiaceae bacterium]